MQRPDGDLLSGVPADSLQVKLFRRQAVEASRFRVLGRLPVATPPGLPVAAGSAVIAGILIMTAAVTIEVPERVRVDGVLMPEGKLLAVRATRAGVVNDLVVGDGDWVHRGQRLLRIGEQQHSSRELSTTASQRLSLERELELLATESGDEYRQAEARLQLAREQYRLTVARLDVAADELASRRQLLEVRSRRLQRAAELLQRNAIATAQHDELREAQLQALAALQDAEQTVIALRSERLAGQQSITLLTAELTRVEARWATAREALLRQLAVLEHAASEPVTAPDGGVVAALLVRNGSAVMAGQLLLQVADPENPLEAYIYLGPELAGRVRPGQRVELRLHAYPYQRFGTIHGTVSFVAAAPVPASTAGIAATGAAYVYEVRARIEPDARNAFAPWSQLPHGAGFSADIVRNRWPLYRWAMRMLTAPA